MEGLSLVSKISIKEKRTVLVTSCLIVETNSDNILYLRMNKTVTLQEVFIYREGEKNYGDSNHICADMYCNKSEGQMKGKLPCDTSLL